MSLPPDERAGFAASSTPPTILVVDDEYAVRTTTAKMISHLGYKTLQAASGPEALAILRTTSEIDLVLLDLTMPDMDGFATFHAIRQLRPNQRIALFSGYSPHDAQQRFAGETIHGFLPKPFTVQALQEILQQSSTT